MIVNVYRVELCCWWAIHVHCQSVSAGVLQVYVACFILYLCLQIFTQSELEMMAEMCHKYNVLCISDEVYEWLMYDDNVFTKIGQ